MYLLSGLQLIPPILQQLVVLFIQMLELLSLVLDQQVTFFILKHKTRKNNILSLFSALSYRP